MVENRYMMNPSPIPKLTSETSYGSVPLFIRSGAGKGNICFPPHTRLDRLNLRTSLLKRKASKAKDVGFAKAPHRISTRFLIRHGERFYQCSDTSHCREVRVMRMKGLLCWK